MIKETSFLSGERTQHVVGWVSIIWFTSVMITAVISSGSQLVMLEATPEVLATCGDNVTLTCNVNVTSQKKLDIKLFSWIGGNGDLCQRDSGQQDPAALCENTTENFLHTRSLTLINVMPVNKGKYVCKLHSNLGVKSATTVLTVQNCLASSGAFSDNFHAVCQFSGVYPNGTVHWFQGDDNLTDHAITEEEKDQQGRYNVQSKIMMEKGKLSQPYNCSLWIHDYRKYVSNMQSIMSQKLSSAASVVKLQWICMLVEIMMLMLKSIA